MLRRLLIFAAFSTVIAVVVASAASLEVDGGALQVFTPPVPTIPPTPAECQPGNSDHAENEQEPVEVQGGENGSGDHGDDAGEGDNGKGNGNNDHGDDAPECDNGDDAGGGNNGNNHNNHDNGDDGGEGNNGQDGNDGNGNGHDEGDEGECDERDDFWTPPGEGCDAGDPEAGTSEAGQGGETITGQTPGQDGGAGEGGPDGGEGHGEVVSEAEGS